MSTKDNKPSAVERLKKKSQGLRGTLSESLENPLTGAIYEDDEAIIKFHGIYQQDDREQREERAIKKLERLYSFMIRLRLPGGFFTADQWLATQDISDIHASGTIKITTRQTVQLHGLLKTKLKPTIKDFDQVKLDSIAACGDINRNVICSAHPAQSELHEEIFQFADKISTALLPKTNAYYEIWLDKEKIADTKVEEDPLYGDTYLPRKFKIAIAIPPDNDVDVLANDIGLIAIVENGKLTGFNVAAGGGLSTTHGNSNTYARLGTTLGFATTEQIMDVVYHITTLQRDHGNRSDRKAARLKYTIDRLGVETFRSLLEERVGFTLQESKPYTFEKRNDHYGWAENHKGLWYYTAFVENGRVVDEGELQLKTGLYEIAKTQKANFRFTCNQNVIIADVKKEDKDVLQSLLLKYGLIQNTENSSPLRKSAMACVALNTCPLALAEGQRYLPDLISRIEPLLQKHDLEGEEIDIRMTGCPNGCARPYLAEVGFIGTSYGHYNVYIGGDKNGERLNTLYKESLDEGNILKELDHLFDLYKKGRKNGEGFGDFLQRTIVE